MTEVPNMVKPAWACAGERGLALRMRLLADTLCDNRAPTDVLRGHLKQETRRSGGAIEKVIIETDIDPMDCQKWPVSGPDPEARL